MKLTERELIERWKQTLPRARGKLRLGIGDDAALYEIDAERYGIFTTDMLVEDVHFRLKWTSPGDLGWKSVAVNLSDIAAMGGAAELVLIAAALPPAFAEDEADAILRGAQECAGAYGAQIAGGDTVRSSGPLVVSVAAFGETPKGDVLRRDSARAGDAVAVTGSFGGAAAALRMLERAERPPADLASRLHRPLPRLEEGQALARAGVHCGLDCSDGLLRSLDLIAEASGVSIAVSEEAIPLDPSVRTKLGREAALELAETGGEDYELVVAGDGASLRASGARLTVIGEVIPGTSARVLLRDASGSVRPASDAGYDAFRR
ncbi:MAG TPA: thiamine-phosphate kinase [Candidatus Limnocylindria bacterium]|nr:thiamine-phosphate kinase [Candidatus Limnocylindria bacterium]